MADFMAEKVVQPGIDPELAAYCPTMDLIALSTIDQQIHVFRLNGQKVFGVSNRKGSGKVNHIRWKPNGNEHSHFLREIYIKHIKGQVLAVAFDGHDLILTNSHTGKKIHRIDCSKFSESQISCVGWGVTFTESTSLSQQIKKADGAVTLEDVISRNPSIKNIEVPPDLPSDLAFLDIEGCFPKLSPLPSGSIEDDLFSTRASMDSIFDTPISSSMDAADVLLVGFEDGTVHISIYDFFEIGTFDLSSTSYIRGLAIPLMHCSHPYSTTHALLTNIGDDLKIVPIDLRLITSAGRYLPFLASKATRLQNLLLYLHQIQRQLYGDFRTSQELPKKFIRNIEEDLKSKSDCTWEQAAYHLVVTGNCHPEVKEWLVDQLGERGYKRWDKAVTTGYESVQRLLHEHLLPALERFTVFATRLRGISRFSVSNANLGLSTDELNNVLDTVSCLQLLAHHLLITTNTEFQQFRAFSVWLHQEIDTQSSEEPNADNLEKGPDIDHMRTLEYIQGAMTQSQLTSFLDSKSESESGGEWDLNAEGRSLFELYKRELNQDSEKNSSKQLPGLKPLLDHLEKVCTTVFDKIGETQKRNIRFARPISLGNGVSDKRDLRMVVEGPDKIEEVSLYIAVGPRGNEHGTVQVYKITFINENGMSKTQLIEGTSIGITGWNLDDIKFVDDDELMLAMSNSSDSCLFKIPYRSIIDEDGDEAGPLTYEKLDEGQISGVSINLSSSPYNAQYAWLEFPKGDLWAPERIEVNGRKGRRVVCVFARDKLHYRVYDLDGTAELEDGERVEAEGDTVMHD